MCGKVQGPAYDTEFRALLHQYDLCSQSIPNFIGLDAFINQYGLEHCQSARTLIAKKASNYKGEELDRNLAQRVFDITTKFMQPMDMLSLNITSVDEILPPLRDVHQALLNYPQLPSDYTGLANVGKWVEKLGAMKASESLDEDEARQLRFELEGAMQRFNDIVLKGR